MIQVAKNLEFESVVSISGDVALRSEGTDSTADEIEVLVDDLVVLDGQTGTKPPSIKEFLSVGNIIQASEYETASMKLCIILQES